MSATMADSIECVESPEAVLPSPADAELLRRYRRGDAQAFSLLYGRHRLGLLRFLCGFNG